jgi:hypothetical protein
MRASVARNDRERDSSGTGEVLVVLSRSGGSTAGVKGAGDATVKAKKLQDFGGLPVQPVSGSGAVRGEPVPVRTNFLGKMARH